MDRQRLLVVEGSLSGGYEVGLDSAVQMAEILRRDYTQALELMVVGKVSQALQVAAQAKTQVPLVFRGKIPGEQIPQVDRSAHLIFAAAPDAACPNSTIEALACGLPVVAFDTGALPELVTAEAGMVVPYGGNPWELDPPDVMGLARGAAEVLADQPRFRQGARRRAEEAFGLDSMVEGYLSCLLT